MRQIRNNKFSFFELEFPLSFLSSTVNDVRRKLYMVGIHSTVGKRAKRLPDTTVETTDYTFTSLEKIVHHLIYYLTSHLLLK